METGDEDSDSVPFVRHPTHPDSHPKVNRVLIDDVLVYGATALEYGEYGDIVDVYAPAIPEHLRNQIGKSVRLRLEYDENDTTPVVDWFDIMSYTEALNGSGAIIRLGLVVCGNPEDRR